MVQRGYTVTLKGMWEMRLAEREQVHFSRVVRIKGWAGVSISSV